MDAVLLAPPLIIDDGEIDEVLEKLGDAVAEVERDL
jgi:adenosylmethionine-8-amino-7-oxononanoate aminotransferase